MFWDTFLSVLGVIGIVAVAAFVIVFLSDLFITIVDGTNGIFFKRHKSSMVEKETRIVKKPKLLSKPIENLMAPKEELQSKKTLEKEVDFDKAQEEEEEIRKINLQRQNLVAQRSAIVSVKEEDEDEDEDEEESLEEKMISSISEEFNKNLKAEEEEDEEEEEEDEEDEEDEEEDDEDAKNALLEKVEKQNNINALEKEIEELKNQIIEAKEIIRELKEKQTEDKSSIAVTGSKEELEQRLEALRLRLKENEKELSVNRKEFVPLRRVNKTLDSDKTKLRRREAIVAKQKVMLYGVNNYVDINEEKAKKLSEELDLLEGLRLSVQHCDEVMQKNVDRYPILERANKFLTKNQSDLKADIESLEQQLKLLEDEVDENDTEN